jgi:PAS domain S-box
MIDLLAQLVEENTDGVAVFDAETRYLLVNKEAERLLQRSRSEILNRTVAEVFPNTGAHGLPFQRHFARAMAEGIGGEYENYAAPIGCWVRVRLVPIVLPGDGDEERPGVVAYFRDITVRKEAQNAHVESEGRFRALANAAPVLIWTSRTDALCDWFNKPWLDFTGRTMEEELGTGWLQSVHPDDVERCLETYQSSFARREPFTMEYRMLRHDGQWRWILDHGVPRYAEATNTFLGFIGSCLDITEQKRYDEEKARLLAERTELVRRQAEHLQQQRAFLKDILFAVTEGVLTLCDTAAELPPPAEKTQDRDDVFILPSATDLRALRQKLMIAASECGLSPDRINDLLTAAGEAAMNSLVHANGSGRVRILSDREQGYLQVWVVDSGHGIAMERLHRAVLERGFTTAGSLGHGFWLMLRTADRVYLLTDTSGTTLVLEQYRKPPTPAWLRRDEAASPSSLL